MSFMAINTDINGNCGGDFSRRVSAPGATEVAPTIAPTKAPTKAEQEVLA